MLGQFVEIHAQDMTKLSECLKRGDRDGARLISHTLKGAAATLGAEQLAELAAKLESSLRGVEEASLSEQEMRTGMESIDLQLVMIAAALPVVTEVTAPVNVTMDSDALKKLLKELDTLLSHSDTAAIALFEENEAVLMSVLSSHAEAFAREIRMFGFDAALRLLRSTPLQALSLAIKK
jgi:HPt (histidine-containing phosphotransfer) domain-containing protein